MIKLFVFSDIHSYYSIFMKALNEAGFDIDNKDHVLVSLGDLCDRGKESKEVLDFINSMDEKRKILIIGNHEMLMEDCINRGSYTSYDKHNKTNLTIQQLTGRHDRSAIYAMRNNSYWRNYKKDWRWYFELDKYIFVHGYIPCGTYNKYGEQMEVFYDDDWRNASKAEWIGASWANGMNLWRLGIKEENKTIVCGHYHTSWGHYHLHKDGKEFMENEGDYARFDPFVDDGIIAIDACTAYTNKVNILVLEIEEKEFDKWYK